ncbi:MAG: glycerate kinase [Thermodesulfobacteriota bacterium]
MENLRSVSFQIIKAALGAVNGYRVVCAHLALERHSLLLKTGQSFKRFDLKRYKSIVVLGAGKASAPMAAACETVLKNRIHAGLIVTKYGHTSPLTVVQTIEAGHPVPDRAGYDGAKKMISLLRACRGDDLIIFLTSGGASAMLPHPTSSISLAEKQKMTRLLLQRGLPIEEINRIRKHISLTKGGQLARWAYPATVIHLILSDVIGDSLETIGSGPFSPDSSTFRDAWEVIEKYRLEKTVPGSISRHLKMGLKREVEDTPKRGDPCFKKVSQVIVANNTLALRAARKKAEVLGCKTIILSSEIQGEARDLAGFYGAIVREVVKTNQAAQRPVCLLAGGEPTVTVTGKGVGGRNMELALAMAKEIRGLPQVLFLSIGTDGTDGPTDAAGAVVTGSTYDRALKKGFSPEGFLKENDSHTFFIKCGGLIKTGPTGTNVMDLHICLVR